jgi:hypothetical protein
MLQVPAFSSGLRCFVRMSLKNTVYKNFLSYQKVTKRPHITLLIDVIKSIIRVDYSENGKNKLSLLET